MKTLKRITIALLLLISFHTAQGQVTGYKTGIGVRLGGTSGITVKGFVNNNSALEGILGFGDHSFSVTGLYERHVPIANAQGLTWFYGGGAHVAFYRYGYPHYYWFNKHGERVYYYYDPEGGTYTIFGIDFILGLDYKFTNAPINLGLDIKPFIDFADGGPYGWFDGAFSFRFVF